MAHQLQSRPEPMNATPHHSKVRLSVTLSDKFYIAGDVITGKMELESRADTGLGLGIIAVELLAIEELTSRDHSATSTFIHTRRFFQGPGLPPSNAVIAHPVAGEPPLPAHYHQARRGLTTFLFRIPLPPSSPPSIDFGNGLARIRYEVSACAGVAWKNQNRLVTSQCPVDVLQRYPSGDDLLEDDDGLHNWPGLNASLLAREAKSGHRRVLSAVCSSQARALASSCSSGITPRRQRPFYTSRLGRHLHLPSPVHGSGGKKAPSPLQISDTLASIAFRGPEYTSNPGTEGIAQLVFDVPRTARTVSAHPRHGAEVDEDEGEAIAAVNKRTTPLFEVRGVVTVRISMPLGSKDIVLELPVAILHPATLPPPPPEPYPYPAPDAYNPPLSPTPPLLHTPMPMLYPPEPTHYAYPTPVPHLINGQQLVIPPYTPHNGQLWFPPSPAYITGGGGDPLYYQPPPLRPASANNLAPTQTVPCGLPVSGTPDHVLSSFSRQQQQTIDHGHGALAARISHHLRATSRARSVSPSPVELLSPKPLPSPKLTTLSVANDDPFAQSFGRKSLSVVKLEEMAARAEANANVDKDKDKTPPAQEHLSPTPKLTLSAAAEDPFAQSFGRRNLSVVKLEEMAASAEANADKTLPAPPVPSRIIGAAPDMFAVADTADVPRTPTLSALSLLRPPQHRPLLQEDGLDALERRLVEQVGTRRHAPTSSPAPAPAAPQAADPPPAPVPAPIAVPAPGKAAAASTEEPGGGGGGGAEMNESAISSLALGAEESFGGRNVTTVTVTEDAVCAGADVEVEDLDARTQRLSKGGATGGASSGSERGTHKARSRKSVKSDRDRDREGKKAKKKREGGRDEEAARMKRAAKGRVAEWLEKLASPEQEQEQERDPKPEPELEPEPEPERAPSPPESKPNPRSSGFISVTTLRRAPISLPPPESLSPAPAPAPPAPIRRVANRYPPPLPPPPPAQVEMKYNVKSARGGRGGRVTAVASIWAEASKEASKPKANKAQPKALAASSTPAAPKPMTSIAKPPTRPSDERIFISRGGRPTPAKEDSPQPQPRAQRALFGLGVAAAATPSSPALSSSIATPVLSSTASLAQPPGARVRARAITPTTPRTPSPQPQQQQPQTAATGTGWRAPLVSGGGLKADLAFGQARLRDLIRRYQGQAT